MDSEYLKIQIGQNPAYVLKASLERLKQTDAIIFDCDGVLIDTRESYGKCIIDTVKFFINELTEVKIPPDHILNEVIYLLRKSGEFNNDWDSTYVILLSLLCKLPKEFQDEFINLANSTKFDEKTLRESFDYLKNSMKSKPSSFVTSIDEVGYELKQFALQVDDSGIVSVEKWFRNSDLNEFFLSVKKFLNYPNSLGQSLLATVFDEIFYGEELFKRLYKKRNEFHAGVGLIEAEKKNVLVTPELMNNLSKVIGKNFGIVSGRDSISAKFSLGNIFNEFREDAVLFLSDYDYGLLQAKEGNMRKPNPEPLIKASKGLKLFKSALYVGDSVEDVLMSKRANIVCPYFASAAIYATSDFPEEFISHLLKMGTELIMHSITDLPQLLKKIKEEKT